jgi:heptosyltransferase-3
LLENRASPLIVRFAAFGDVVLLTTLIDAVFNRFGTPVDLLGSGAWTTALLGADPRVGHIRLVRSRRAPYLISGNQRSAVRWLRSRPRGPVYLCDPEPKSRWLLQRAGIDDSTILPIHYDLSEGEPHWSDWWAACGRRAPPAYAQVPPGASGPTSPIAQLHVSESDIADCEAWLTGRGWTHAPLVLIQPGNKRTLKRGRFAMFSDRKYWPARHWAAVAAGVITALPEAQVLLCGVPSERGVIEDIRRASGCKSVHNLAADFSPRRLLPLLLRAHSMISVDTGPAHAAAALDCPLVVMFANARQHRWLPRSRRARVVPLGGTAGDYSRMIEISVADVLAAWRSL